MERSGGRLADSGESFADYNAFWSRYVRARTAAAVVAEREPHALHSRLARGMAVSHVALAHQQHPPARTVPDTEMEGTPDTEEDTATVVVAPSPFDYIATVMQHSHVDAGRSVSLSARTPPSLPKSPPARPAWDVDAGRSSLQEAAKSLLDEAQLSLSNSPCQSSAQGGATSSRRDDGGSTVRRLEDDEAREADHVSPWVTAAGQTPVHGHARLSRSEDVPRRLFPHQEAVQEINLSDVSAATDGSDEAVSDAEARSPPPRAPTRSALFDVNANIASRHAPASRKPAPALAHVRYAGLTQEQDRAPTAADEPALWRLYGAHLTAEEWSNPELRSFLAFRQAQETHRAALYHPPLSSTTVHEERLDKRTSPIFRRVYAASGGRRPGALSASDRSPGGTPAVFVAPPATSARRWTTTAPPLSMLPNALTPSSPASRFIQWVADDIDLYLDLAL